jgi:hypothetical protein
MLSHFLFGLGYCAKVFGCSHKNIIADHLYGIPAISLVKTLPSLNVGALVQQGDRVVHRRTRRET